MSDHFYSLGMLLQAEPQSCTIRSVLYWLAIEENA